MSTQLNVIAMSVGPFIVTGRHFARFTEDERSAIIEHERGHIKYLHALRRIWWLLSFQWGNLGHRCKMQEFEADRHAVLRGKGHGLIQFLARQVPHESPLHPTSQERIENIKRWVTAAQGDFCGK